jgi:hypothetical protein
MQHLSRMAAAEPTRVAMHVGAAIEVAERARSAEVRDRAHEAVQRLVGEARAHVDRR